MKPSETNHRVRMLQRSLPFDAQKEFSSLRQKTKRAQNSALVAQERQGDAEIARREAQNEAKRLMSSYQEAGLYPSRNGTLFVDPRKWPGVKKGKISDNVKVLPLGDKTLFPRAE